MVLDNKVSISIMSCVMFQRFLGFDIPIVSKKYVSYKILLVFPIYVCLENKFCIMSCLWHYFVYQFCVTSLYIFFFYVSNTLIFFYPLNFMKHGLYGFDKKNYRVVTMFQRFRNMFIKKNHIIGAYFRWLFKSIQHNC
jgi:hypothetical protein